MKKRKKVVFIIAIIFVCVAAGLFSVWYFSVNNQNTRRLKAILSDTQRVEAGKVEELFPIDYDILYVFAPYEAKSRMESRIGFSTKVLEESVSESCINYLFVKEKKPVGYLYGLPSNIGFCINLQPGEYSKQELDEMFYEVEKRKAGNNFGKEKTYQDYNFYYQDKIMGWSHAENYDTIADVSKNNRGHRNEKVYRRQGIL